MKLLGSIKQTLSFSELIIDGVLAHPELIKATEPFGYNKKSFVKGKAKLENTRLLFNTKDECYKEKKRATQELKSARYELRQTYLRHAGMLRAYYRQNASELEQLGVNQSTPAALDPFLTRAQRFYASVQTLMENAIGFPFMEEEVTRAQAMIRAISEARVRQFSKKGAAQRTTQLQNEALKDLRQWVRDFLTVAKIAFRDDPQQMEMLGIIVKAS